MSLAATRAGNCPVTIIKGHHVLHLTQDHGFELVGASARVRLKDVDRVMVPRTIKNFQVRP